MSTLSTRPPDGPRPPDPDEDDYSPAFAAWAMLLTFVVLTSLVVALWALKEI
jgi:hypothetical protein